MGGGVRVCVGGGVGGGQTSPQLRPASSEAREAATGIGGTGSRLAAQTSSTWALLALMSSRINAALQLSSRATSSTHCIQPTSMEHLNYLSRGSQL